MNYAEASVRLQGVSSRKLCNNTYLQRRGDDIAVVLHGTDVITLHPDGSFTLDSGGWQTATTKNRMNRYMPVGCVLQEEGVWSVFPGGEDKCRYRDGMVIDKDGTVAA